MKRIVIASTQYPYYGGAATNSYALVKYFRKKGFKAVGIFFDNHSKLVDPDQISGVWRCSNPDTFKLVKKMAVSYLGGRPDIILGKNYSAPINAKKMFKNIPVAYLVTGCPHMMKMSDKGMSARRYLQSDLLIDFPGENRCVKTADYVIPNSDLGRKLLIKHHGDLQKITAPIDTSMVLNRAANNRRPFGARQYDIAFVCSNLERKVKNAELAYEIFKSFPKARKVVIGKNNSRFKSLPNTKVYGILPHKEVINVVGNSRLVICTSFYDASPNVIKEALYCGSNILLSKNCGWSESYPNFFVCSDIYRKSEWIQKAQYLTRKKVKFSLPKNDNIAARIREIIE